MPEQEPLFLMRVICGSKEATLATTRRLEGVGDVVSIGLFCFDLPVRSELVGSAGWGLLRTVALRCRGDWPPACCQAVGRSGANRMSLSRNKDESSMASSKVCLRRELKLQVKSLTYRKFATARTYVDL
jgi:hypothetical protein